MESQHKGTKKSEILHVQGGPEFMEQTLMVGRGHEDKHYLVGNHRAQTSSVGTRGALKFKVQNFKRWLKTENKENKFAVFAKLILYMKIFIKKIF